MKKKIIIIFLSLMCGNTFSQTITPQVINSAGRTYPAGVNGVFLTDNIGEPFTETLNSAGNIMITQGFLQPELISKIGPTITIIKNDVSCSDKNDGSISTSLSNILPGYTVQYVWSGTVCPSNDCNNLDSLSAGTYSAIIILSHTTTSGINTDTLRTGEIVINDLNGPCKVKIFNAITPNGDNINDVWEINNITEFPKNRVMIFNRWGTKIKDIEGYDNATKFWPEKDDLDRLDASTYFYIIDLGEGGKPLKGWVELLKN